MFWKRIISVIMGLTLPLFFLPIAIADTFTDKDYEYYGEIISIDDNQVTFRQGCDGNNRKTISWTNISFDSRCDKDRAKRGNSLGNDTIGVDYVAVFIVYCKQDGSKFYAGNVTLDSNSFQATSIAGDMTISCASSDLKGRVTEICSCVIRRDEIPKTVSRPDGFN